MHLLADGNTSGFEMGVLEETPTYDDGLCEGGDLTSVRQPCPTDEPTPTATPTPTPTTSVTPNVSGTKTSDQSAQLKATTTVSPTPDRLLVDDIRDGFDWSWAVFLIIVVSIIGIIITMLKRR